MSCRRTYHVELLSCLGLHKLFFLSYLYVVNISRLYNNASMPGAQSADPPSFLASTSALIEALLCTEIQVQSIITTMFNLKAIFSLVALWVSLVTAQQLTITEPSSDRWWIAQSINTLRWNCEQTTYTNWTVLITNPDVTVLSGPLALIAIHVWATSQPFEVKAVGSAYPPEYTSTGVPGTGPTGTTSSSHSTAAPTTTSTPSANNGAIANTAMSALIGLTVLGAIGLVL
ncbi:hypothetical protein AG1IA_05625 [Rhizoctonia solani AG-1 IA]|uniref:Uncharacterized protein n=1 Tax=Thanatephorus cucumeris (strain AG1-IA) TaxID=983506 RepID=L8WQT5_THACA|nr:hypothetical protein AG1IA_05625 [Rhizoctonia solani AG-1 IA]